MNLRTDLLRYEPDVFSVGPKSGELRANLLAQEDQVRGLRGKSWVHVEGEFKGGWRGEGSWRHCGEKEQRHMVRIGVINQKTHRVCTMAKNSQWEMKRLSSVTVKV